MKKDRQSWTDRELFNSNGPVSGLEVQADDGLCVHKIRARWYLSKPFKSLPLIRYGSTSWSAWREVTGGDCGTFQTLLLDKDEFICAASGYSNDITGVSTSLSVTTSKRKIWGPFGDSDMHGLEEQHIERMGSHFSLRNSPDERWIQLTHLSGNSGFGRKEIRLHWSAAKTLHEAI